MKRFAMLALFASCTSSIGATGVDDQPDPGRNGRSDADVVTSEARPGQSDKAGVSGAGAPSGDTATQAALAREHEKARAAISAANAHIYARRVVGQVVGRSLNATELSALEKNGGAALRSIVGDWVAEPAFAKTARDYTSIKLKASGQREGLDLDLPGNLAEHLVKNKRPHEEILTARTCFDRTGQETACDTGAPYGAGVLGTRAFLSNNASRFNLKRARAMMGTFACLDYPMPHELQPPLERDLLIAMFKVDQAPDGTSGAFGNGHACYACHSQFGAHAQLFVRFDSAGVWKSDATGLQEPGGEPGRSKGTLFTSHMQLPERARDESSQMLGHKVANLAAAAAVIAESPLFLPCATRSFMGFVFGLADSEVLLIPDAVIEEIVAAARAAEAKPTLAKLTHEALTHPAVIRSLLPSQGER